MLSILSALMKPGDTGRVAGVWRWHCGGGREVGTVIVVLGNKGCALSLTIYFSQVRYGVW